MKKNVLVLEYILLIIVAVLSFWLFSQIRNQEVNFSRDIFNGLIKGRVNVAKFIDWDNFQAMDVNVRETYSNIRDEKEKSDYKKALIKGFSWGFRQAKGGLNAFKHWRIYAQDENKVIVAADYLGYNKTLLFTFSKYPKKKLISLQWK